MSATLWLREAAAAGQAAAGGKAVRLGELSGQGFDVPPGFVVTSAAFVAHFTAAGAAALLEGEDPTPQHLARVRAHPLDPALAREILGNFDLLARDTPGELRCAVRSSSADEDGTAASFAGQHATYYYTGRDELITRIVDCWLSSFAAEARAYRRQLGIVSAPRMAVIVQYLVPAAVSGVAFTRDPTGRHPESVVIESSWGLGAALVDGRVSPDAFRVSRGDCHVEARRLGSKRLKVTESLLDPKGARLEAVPRHLQGQPTLDAESAARVGRLALACEQVFGVAQDVEWAIAGERLYLLQSRPITRIATSPRPVAGRWIAFKPVLENSTAPFTPLTVDLLRRMASPAFRFIDGRIYLDFDLARRMLPVALNERDLVDALLLRKSSLRLRVDWRRVGLAVFLGIVGYLSAAVTLARTRSLPRAVFEDFGRRCAEILADDALDPLASLKAIVVPRHPFGPIGEQVLQANVASVRYFMLLGVLDRLIARHAPGFAAEHVAALVAGREAMMSRDMIRDLEALAALARRTPAIERLLRADHFDELPQQLAALPEGGAFAAALTAFMNRFGHRGTREIELASPRWREDPAPLFAMLRNVLHDDGGANARQGAEARRQAAERELDVRMRGRLRRWLTRRLARRISYYAALRENTRHWHALGFATVRRKIQGVEAQLLAGGQLKCADDIYFLGWDEIVELQAGRIAWRDVEERIRKRRIRHQRRANQQAPLAFNVALEPERQGSLRLTGRCASPGTAAGRARIVTDPAVDGQLAPGDVLIAPFTDPSWTPLFLNASAVVVETGSYLSHAGTIARELGIPCLVDVSGVMEAVVDGQQVRVDATAGVLWLPEAAEERH